MEQSKVPEDTTFNPEDFKEEDFQEIKSDTEPAELGEFVKFNSIGDSLTGLYEGTRMFKSRLAGEQQVYDVRTQDGLFTITGNWDLNEKMGKVRAGAWIRVTYVDDKPMRQGLTPMRIFKVEVSRSQHGVTASGKKSPIKNIGIGNRKG